jgi:hypothetical protein
VTERNPRKSSEVVSECPRAAEERHPDPAAKARTVRAPAEEPPTHPEDPGANRESRIYFPW